MPTKNRNTGYALLVVGVLILGFTLFEAYGLFTKAIGGSLFGNVQAQQTTVPQLPINNTTSARELEGSMLSAMESQMVSQIPLQQDLGYVLAILLLGIFASVGYKFSSLGISLLRQGNEK